MENASEKTAFTVRVNTETKNKADQVASKLGINLTAAINMFVEQFARDGEMPFQPTTKEKVYTEDDLDPAMVAMLKRRIADMKDNSGVTESELAAMFANRLED